MNEVFATGTMGELTPIVEIDGRKIESETGSDIREQLSIFLFDSLEERCAKL